MVCWRLFVSGMLGVVVGGAIAVCAASPAGASCVAPSLAVSQTVLVRGKPFEVRGAAFGTACNDTGQPGPVLGDPQTGVAIALVQAGHAAPMFSVDAAADYTFRVRAVLPASANPGAATLRVVASDLPGVARSIRQVHLWVRGSTAVVYSSPPPPTFLTGKRMAPPSVAHGAKSTQAWAWAVGIGVAVAAGVALAVGRSRRRISTE